MQHARAVVDDGQMRPRLRLVQTDTTTRLVELWTVHMRAAGMRPRTVADRAQFIHRVERRVGGRADQWSSDDLARYLSTHMAPATRQTYYSALRAWSKWLVLHGHRGDDPTLLLPTPRVPRAEPRPITTTHLRVLLASPMRRRTRMLILLCAYQGLRISEAVSVRGEDVDLIGDRLRVVGKGGVDAVIPLHSVIRCRASRWPQRGWWFPAYGPNVDRPDGGGPILRRSASTLVSTAMRRAGVPGTAHSLRHWHATTLLATDTDSRVVQTLLRHASLTSTQRYTAVDVSQQRAALDRLPDVS